MRIAFLVQLPKKVSPGQRFRVEQFEPLLRSGGFRLDTFPFIGRSTYPVLYKPGHLFRKMLGVMWGFCKRFFFLFQAWRYDFVFIQREASPLGPPVFEWILTRLLRRKVIFDFDDAIWISDSSGGSRWLRFAKCFWKIKYICRWSYKVSVGNQFLADYAARYSSRVVMIPTSVDTDSRYNRQKLHDSEKPVIGWTGSHSTLKYLDRVLPVLKELERAHSFEFLVICDRPPAFELSSLRFLPWSEASEISDLLRIHIGIMPLVEDAWSKGKCGFKLIQYMALGIPAVADPIGVNSRIIDHGVSGFLCSTPEEWSRALSALLSDPLLRERMGEKGRAKIVSDYSLQANEGLFLSLFE